MEPYEPRIVSGHLWQRFQLRRPGRGRGGGPGPFSPHRRLGKVPILPAAARGEPREGFRGTQINASGHPSPPALPLFPSCCAKSRAPSRGRRRSAAPTERDRDRDRERGWGRAVRAPAAGFLRETRFLRRGWSRALREAAAALPGPAAPCLASLRGRCGSLHLFISFYYFFLIAFSFRFLPPPPGPGAHGADAQSTGHGGRAASPPGLRVNGPGRSSC